MIRSLLVENERCTSKKQMSKQINNKQVAAEISPITFFFAEIRNARRDTHQNQQLLFNLVISMNAACSYDLDADSAHLFRNYGKWCGLGITGLQCQRCDLLMVRAPRNWAELATLFQVQAEL